MKRLLLCFSVMLLTLSAVFSQNRISITEQFDRQNSCTFTRLPSQAWVFDTTVSTSGKSIWGFVPTEEGDSIELLSPMYDFSQYSYIILRFSHICKVSDSDEVTIEYKENYPGAKWTRIPTTCYMGSGETYRKNGKFSQSSYSVWERNNMMAMPEKHWWQTESFDVSAEVALAEVQFKFKLKKGSHVGTNFAWGWLIDNFELLAATSEIRPPVVEIISPFVKGTVYDMGPHTIYAKAAPRTLVRLQTPELRVNYISSKGVKRYDTLLMTPVRGDSVWKAEIPLQVVGTQVDYTVYATDTVGNNATAASSYTIGRTWEAHPNCAAILSIDTPMVGALAGQQTPVGITIQNRGTNTLMAATIEWSVNGVSQTPVQWTGMLEEGLAAKVLVGNYIPTANHMDTLIVRVRRPNASAANPTADSLMQKNVFGCSTIPSGTYNVSNSSLTTPRTYKKIGDVLDMIRSCGTSGDVTILIEDGSYVEHVDLSGFMDYMAPNAKLVITSKSKDASRVTLVSDTIISPNIQMSRSARIEISHLTLQGGGSGILMEDTNCDIEISNCRLLLDTLTQTNSYYGIAMLNSTAKRVRISNNLIEGAYYGFFANGVSLSSAAADVEFTGNTVRSPYYGNKMTYVLFTKLNGNSVVARPSAAAAFYGLQLTNCSADEVSQNRIHATTGVPASYGIYASNFNQDSSRSGLFANNEILMNSTAISYGIYVAASEARFYNNTVVMFGTGASRAMYCNNSTRGMSMHFFNNIFVCYNAGYPAYITANNFIGSDIKLDFNNYYGNSYVGYLAGNRATMAAWTQYSKEQNAANINPTFQNYSVSGRCFVYNGLYCSRMADVTTDLLDSARSLQTVMGCYSANALGVDAALTEFVGWPTHLSNSNPAAVSVRLLNAGGSPLTSVTIRWSVNGTEQTPFKWSGQMASYADTVLSIGNYIPKSRYNNVVVWISGVNGLATDNSQEDDTLRNSVFACGGPLSGDYNVGGANADFADLKEAYLMLNTCGLGGHVVLRLAPGHYAAMRFVGRTIRGMSDSTTVTLTTRHDTDKVIIDGVVGTSYTTAWGICLDSNAAYYHFDNLILDCPNSYAGICVIGKNNTPAHHITISRCTIQMNPTTTGTQYGLYGTNGNANGRTHFQIYSNHFDGGARAIEFYCGKGAGHRIDSNLLTNQYQYGINIQNLSLTSISYNTIICRSEFSNTQFFPFSVRVDSVSYACHNRIIADRFMFARCDGFYLSGNSCQRANDTAWIFNNEIRVRAACTSSILYGMYIAGLQANIYHNSVYANVDSPSSTRNAYGLYAYYKDATRVVNIKNNLVIMQGGGSTNVYPLYLNVNDKRYRLDHNVFYSTSAGKQVAYIAKALTNFSDVKALDSNAYWGYPEYVNLNNNLQIIARPQFVCPALVKNDIQGVVRKKSTAIGAYDGVLLTDNVCLMAFASPAATSGVTGKTENVAVVVENRGDSVIRSLTLNWSVNGTAQRAVQWKGSIAPKAQEQISLGSFVWVAGTNRMEVVASLPNGVADQSPADDTLRSDMYGCTYAPLNGKYLVGGKGGHFSTLDDAMNALRNCGISGPVTMAIAKGVYPAIEQVGAFPGSSAANMVTFTSQSGNAADVVIGSSDPKAVSLNTVSNLIFENLTIGNPVVTQFGVELAGVNNSLYFRHCLICADTTSTGGAYAVSVASGSTNDGVFFIGNHIDGGYTNVNAAANSSGAGMVLDSNLMTNAYRYGISTSGGSYMHLIAHNDIRCRKNATANYTAINWGSSSKFDTVACNRIYIDNVSAQAIGMFVGVSVRSGACWVTNNEFFINSTSTSTCIGMRYDVSGGAGAVGSWVNFVHNTFAVFGKGACYAMYHVSTTSGSPDSYNPSKPAKVMYNNFYTNGNSSSSLLYFDLGQFAAAPYREFDYNNYFTTGQNLAVIGGTAAVSVNDISLLTLKDANSISEEPIYTNYPASLHTDGKRLLVSTDTLIVKGDLEGFSRPKVGFTNIGCYHDYRPNRFDAKLEAIVSPTKYVSVGTAAPVEVVITNMGTDRLDSVEIHWNATGTAMPVYRFHGSLAYGEQSKPVSIGSFMPVGGTNTLTVWVEKPNGGTDGNNDNDTASIQIMGCDSALAGTYRVGRSAQAKYKDLKTAVNALAYCGISGPVVFEIESGVYDKMVIEGAIKGSSSTNTVKFVSLAKDKSLVVIGGDATVGLTLNGTGNLIFEHLTIGSSTDGENGVKFLGAIRNVTVTHCVVSASETVSKGEVISYLNKEGKSDYMIDVRLIGNEIRGGAAGVVLVASAGSIDNCMAGIKDRSSVVVDSNIFVNNGNVAFEATQFNHIASFSHNTITARQGTRDFTAAVFQEYNLVDSIIGNRIRLQTTSSSYGLMLNGWVNSEEFGKSVNPVFIANNEILCTGGSMGIGISLSLANVHLMHNSIYASCSKSNYGVILEKFDKGYQFTMQQCLTVCGNGSENHTLYIPESDLMTTITFVADYNDYFNINDTNIIFCGKGLLSLSQWKKTYSVDKNSVSQNPYFKDPTVSLEIHRFTEPMKCQRSSLVMQDINGQARTRLTVMGAYSTPLYEGNDLAMDAFVEPVLEEIPCVPNATPVKVCVYNQGTNEIDFSSSPMKLYLKCESDSVNIQTSIVVSSGKIGVMGRDTFEVIPNLDITYLGLYKLTSWLECSRNEQSVNDTIRLDYQVNKTILPYENNFSGAYAGVKMNQAYGDISWEVVNNNPVLNTVYGSGSMLFRSSEARGSISQALFSSVRLQGTYRPQLYFWYAHDNANPNLRDQLDLRISQDGGVTFKTIYTTYRYDAKCTTPTWKQHHVDLSNFTSGSCIVLAFTAYSYGGGDQTIDQVRIVAMQDMQLRVDAPSDTDFYACNLSGHTLTAYLENLTSQEVPFQPGDSITVMMSGASNFVYKKALTGRLEDLEIDTLRLGPIDYSASGKVDVTVYVTSVDSNTANDTVRFSLNLNPDLAVTKYDVIGFKEPGDTLHVGFTMKNVGNLDILSPFEVRAVVNGEDTVTEMVTTPLPVGATMHYRFQQAVKVPPTTADQPYYLIDVFALMPCDANSNNDSLRIIGNVNVVDNGILSIITPMPTPCAMGGELAKVEVRLYNNGNVDGTDSLVVTAVIDSAGVACATLTEKVAPLMAGENNRNYTFKQQYRVPRLSLNGARAAYKVTVFLTAAEGDIDLENDTASVEACVEGGVGIGETVAERWTVGQNIPNPAGGLTRIPYTLPEPGMLTFRIMSLNGQVLYREEVSAEAGSGTISVNLSDFASGIYYYSVEYRGERIVKKMTVTR